MNRYSIHTEQDAKKFIEELSEECKGKNYMFRGTNRNYSKGSTFYPEKRNDGINSELYRSIVYSQYDRNKNIYTYEEVFNEYFTVVDAEEEFVKRAKMSFSDKGNIDILTETQHLGGKTNLIDVTKELLIALFFACNSEFEEDAELLFLCSKDIMNLNIDALDYNKKENMPELSIILPSKTNLSEKRVKVQSSVFVYPKKGYICQDTHELVIKPIYKNEKNFA